MTVQIAPNIKKQTARVDINGNEIDPATKQIIRSANEGSYTPTPEEITALTNKSAQIETGDPVTNEPVQVASSASPLTIQQQIDEAKANLAKLEELKQLKIKEMETQLELLKSQ